MCHFMNDMKDMMWIFPLQWASDSWYAAVHSPTAVTAYFSSRQLLHFVFADQSGFMSNVAKLWKHVTPGTLMWY